MKSRIALSALCLFALSSVAEPQGNDQSTVKTHCVLLYSKLIKKVTPGYPPLARQVKVQGHVSMNCIIGSDGSVERIEVTKGHPLLIPAATDAVGRWKFKPPMLNGKGVKTTAKIDIDFRLIPEREK